MSVPRARRIYALAFRCSCSRGISSTRLQGRKRLSICHLRLSSQPTRQAPGEAGRARR
jgi:hypothetical protein